MMIKLAAGFSLLGLCVVVHAAGLTLLLSRRLNRIPRGSRENPPRMVWILVQTAAWLVGLHLVEIALWGVLFRALGCMNDLESAMYFSGVTYTTVGYGDLVLPREWSILGPIEGLTGILLCGLSTSFFFVLLSRLFDPKWRMKTTDFTNGTDGQ
jgi:Ion channel